MSNFPAAWHWPHTALPSTRSFCECGSWQSLQVTPRAMHPALQPRTPDEYFVALLAVDVIQPRHQQRRQVVVHEALSGAIALGDLRAPRMALRADLDLALARALAAARRVAGRRVDAPADAAPFVELNRQPLARIGGLAVGPRDMSRAGAVTRLAADRDLVPVRCESVLGRVVAFGDLARVTVRTHEVPVLRAPCPVQFVAEIDLLVRVLPEPALAAGILGPCIPGHRERLQAAAWQLDEVLLQRLDAEGVLDFEVGELAVGAVGADEEFAVAFEEVRCDALVGELRVVEVAAHGLRGRVLHCSRVLRRGPCGVLLLVTGLAGETACEARDDRRCDGGIAAGGVGARASCHATAASSTRAANAASTQAQRGDVRAPLRWPAGGGGGTEATVGRSGLRFLLTGEMTDCGCEESFRACYGPLAVGPASAVSGN